MINNCDNDNDTKLKKINDWKQSRRRDHFPCSLRVIKMSVKQLCSKQNFAIKKTINGSNKFIWSVLILKVTVATTTQSIVVKSY